MSVAIMTDHPLKRWRHREGITQAELARRCGVRINTVARWERGEQVPRGALLVKLLDATGLPADAIVTPERFLEQHPDFPGAPQPRPDEGDA